MTFGVADNVVASDIVLDWYDGPLRGLVHTVDGNIFYYHAIAWAADYELRLFALRPVQMAVAVELERALEVSCSPRQGADWIPTPIQDGSSKYIKAQEAVARLVESTGSVSCLILGSGVKGDVRVLHREQGPEDLFIAADRSTRVDDLSDFLDLGE
ncbi:hypothetical protein [Mitsuaria sp. 7]|uniref:hypothetical protein n=1 Tax=Mitsuaria sp. 7 TaxID=1658665 RepID=UPI0012FCD03A|nr:hypothetical protein [Mitsuaria sp. 7]